MIDLDMKPEKHNHESEDVYLQKQKKSKMNSPK